MEGFGFLFAKEASPLAVRKYNSQILAMKSYRGEDLEEFKPEKEGVGAEETPCGAIQSAKSRNVLSSSYSSI